MTSEMKGGRSMAKKINCWEYMKCGREPKGEKAKELGVCPAATYSSVNGLNGGINGGRICWAVAGAYSFGGIKGTFSQKKFFCYDCEFHRKVLAEEGIVLNLEPVKVR